ncbi:MAG: Hsp20/alpha crystallin family protein [Allosphingosinicella sp.]
MDIRDLMPWVAPRGASPVASGDHPLHTLQSELNRVFDSLLRTIPGGGAAAAVAPFLGTGPRVDVAETETEIKVAAELPGLEEKDIEVSLSGDLLIIKGEKKAETDQRLLNYHISERVFGAFNRSIPLPSGIDATAVTAVFRNGVLTITVPKTQEAVQEAKRIAVKTD